MSDVLPVAEQATAPESRRAVGRKALRGLARRPTAVVGIVGTALILTVALLAPVLAPHAPTAQNLGNILAPPFWSEGGSLEHPLGTDALGRDVASRIMFGARNSLLIGISAMLIGSTLGLTTGVLAGYFGGRTDTVLMRLGDIQLAFPFILLAIAILGVMPDRRAIHLIVVLGIPGWIVYARVVRSRVLAEREKEYVLAARAMGAGTIRRLVRYVLPSTWQVVPVIAMLDVGFLVIMESTLSFLGIGLQPPAASWGSMLADGRRNMIISPWLPVLPGFAIMLTVLSINLVADGLADVLDPKLAKGTFRRIAQRQPVDQAGEADDDAPLLCVRDLRVEFPVGERVIRAVRGIDFDLRRGETLGIVGESGSGKSVTALSIMQLLDSPGRVSQGRILFEGRDLTRISDRAMDSLRGRRIGMIFQNPAASLNPVLTVGFQMTEAIRHNRRVRSSEARTMARDALRSVGMGDPDRVLRQYPFQLSGGMNQRVMIAMVMSARPDLLIADEPTTALDVTTQAEILGQLREITRAQGASMILISHDIALVADYADTILVMYAGQVCELGPARRVVNDPRHPYTRALLESVPHADLPAGARLQAIPGELPDPAAVHHGCPFAPRCSDVMDVCRLVNPDHFRVGPDHRAACHLWSAESVEAVVE
jgi:peptide/nickel transport system permease protein